MEIKIRVLVILHYYMIPKYNLKHFHAIFVHSYMIPEHFHTIPSQTKTLIPVTPIFNHLFC